MLKMLAAYARPGAGIEGVELREVPVPEPGPGEALVRLTAATLNYRDLLCTRGQVSQLQQPDYVPLSDGAGKVVAVGDDVTRINPGDRVSPLFAQGWLSGSTPTPDMLGGPVNGVARQYAVFHAESLCLLPAQLGDLEAATIPCAGTTAWNALFGARPLRAGDWVLVQGTGGVSIAALQWAKAIGAHVIVTSSSDDKLRRAKEMGADITINYSSSPDWTHEVTRLRGEKGVDIVVDVVGAYQLQQCASVLADDGVIAAIGLLSGEPSWGKDVGKAVVPVMPGNRDQHEYLLELCGSHGIRPHIDAVYDLERLPDAMRLMERGEFFGKIGIELS